MGREFECSAEEESRGCMCFAYKLNPVCQTVSSTLLPKSMQQTVLSMQKNNGGDDDFSEDDINEPNAFKSFGGLGC